MLDDPYRFPAGNVQIAFSGGRTSGFMLHEILRVNGDLPERVVVAFQNTGREMPETLDFVHEIGCRWGVSIVWLEYRHVPGDTPTFEVVDHNSASRNGEPFEQLIRRRRYLPNPVGRFCTEELKIRTAKRYLRSLGWDYWTVARGIRADERRRLHGKPSRDRWVAWHPLAEAGITKADVTAFWQRQPFDLRLPNHNGMSLLGNCDGCFLKGEATLAMLARDYPGRHARWERMEAEVTDKSRKASGARWRKEYSRRELRGYVERQGDWLFNVKGALCQADDGDCMG